MRVGFSESPTRTIFGAVTDANAPTHRVTQNIAIHGRLFEEGKILAVARAIEERVDVWAERPPIG